MARLARQKNLAHGALPNFVCIGAMKCGTTSLHFYLNRHPQICMSYSKEPRFFLKEFNWSRGVSWYKAQFKKEADAYGEISPSYTGYPIYRDVPQRLHSIIPEAKLIYLVRDPIRRIISHYVHMVAAGVENRSIEEVIRSLGRADDLICRSRYAAQLMRFLPYYPLSKILIVSQEQLLRHRLNTLSTIFKFIGVREDFTSWTFGLNLHSSFLKRRLTPLGETISKLPSFRELPNLPPQLKYSVQKLLYFPVSKPVAKPVLTSSLQHKIVDLLGDEVEQFRRLTGRKFEEWTQWNQAERN